MVEPELCVRTQPFTRAIQFFKEHCYASKMHEYQPPTVDGPGSPIEPSDGESGPSIYREWLCLHVATQVNLREFEDKNFELPGQVFGVEKVRDLVSGTTLNPPGLSQFLKSARKDQRYRKTL